MIPGTFESNSFGLYVAVCDIGAPFSLKSTLNYQTLLFCRVPIHSILRFIIRTYKKVGFGRLRWADLLAESAAVVSSCEPQDTKQSFRAGSD